MKKKLLFLIMLISFLFPIKSFALSGNVTFSCNSTTVNVNDEIRCKITGYSDLQVSEIFANLSADGSMRIKNFRAERIWDIRSEWPNLSLYSTTKNPGNFEIGTVYLTATSAGTGTFYMSGITFNGEDGSTVSVPNKSVSVTVKGTTPTPTPDPTPTPTPEPPVVKSSDSSLKSLTVSTGKFDFNPTIKEYNIEVGSNINTIRFEAVPNDTKATVKLPDSLSLKEGANQFLIVVTAEDSSTTTYTINVNKLEKILSDNALLTSLKINGYNIKFSKDVFEYNLGTIKSNKLDINAISEDEKSTVVILGNDNIGKDDTVIIKVTSEAGTVKRYIIYASYEESVTPAPVVDNSMLTIVSALFAFASFIVFLLVVTRKKIKVRKKEKDPAVDEAKRAKELEKKQKQEALRQKREAKKKEKELLKQQKLQAAREARLKKETEIKLAEAKKQEEMRQRKLQEEQRRLEEIARKEALAKEKNDQAALEKAAKEKEKQLREIKLREEKERAEREKAEREAAKKESEKRLKEEKERAARVREDRERHKREMEEKARETKKLQDEREKLEKERAKLERIQQEQEKRDNSEKTKEEKERLKKEQAERAKAVRELEEQYKQEIEKEKKLKAERDKAMKEKMTKERIEQEKAAKEQAKQDKIDAAKQKELDKLRAKEAKPDVEEEYEEEYEEEVDNEALIKERYKDSENISSERVEKVVNSAPAPETVAPVQEEEEEDDSDVMEISPEEVLSVVKRKKKKKMSNAINAKNNN